MRIPLDEQLPHQLAPHLVGHDVRTVQQESWVGLKNRALLTRAEDAGFSVFVTGDQNLEFQQNIYRDGPSQAGFARLLGRSWATLGRNSRRRGDNPAGAL